MTVHVASFLESIGGSIDKDHYLRPLPGRPGYAAYCHKPDYSKKKRKEMSERPMVRRLVRYRLRQVLSCVTLYNAKHGQRNIVPPCAKPADTSACQTQKVNLRCLRGCMTMSKKSCLRFGDGGLMIG